MRSAASSAAGSRCPAREGDEQPRRSRRGRAGVPAPPALTARSFPASGPTVGGGCGCPTRAGPRSGRAPGTSRDSDLLDTAPLTGSRARCRSCRGRFAVARRPTRSRHPTPPRGSGRRGSGQPAQRGERDALVLGQARARAGTQSTSISAPSRWAERQARRTSRCELRLRLDQDEDPLDDRLRRRGSSTRGAAPGLDVLGHLAQGQLAQRAQVLGGEEVRERRLDPAPAGRPCRPAGAPAAPAA